MKNIITLLLFIYSMVFAQEGKEYFSIKAKSGIYIKLGNTIPNNTTSSYLLERKKDENELQILAEITAPKTKDEFINNLKHFSFYFPNYKSPSPEFISRIWEKSVKTSSIDSIIYWGSFPVINLALGTAYLDTTVNGNSIYEYKISPRTLSAAVSNHKYTSIIKSDISLNNRITCSQKDFINNKINLEFLTPKEKAPNSFVVYREDNFNNNFKKINPIIGLSVKYNDLAVSIIDEPGSMNKIVRYFVVPIDLYENEGKSSDTITVANYNFSSAYYDKIKTSHDSSSGIILRWNVNSADIIKSTRIYKSNIFDSNYIVIGEVSPDVKSFIDIDVEPMKNYHYALSAVGYLNENSPLSVKTTGMFESLEKPFPPLLMHVEGINNGIKLMWKNNESFIKGIYIYRNNGFDDKLELYSNLIISKDSVMTFYDTSNGMSAKGSYKYALKNESISHIQSSFSDTLSARPKIATIPLSPINLEVNPQDAFIKVSWENMKELDNSIIAYQVYKKLKTEKEFSRLDTLLFTNYYEDYKVQHDKQYEYAVKSMDDFGGISNQSAPVLSSLAKEIPAAPNAPTIFESADGIVISFDPVLQEGISSYKIYRYQRNITPELIGNVIGNETSFIDTTAVKGSLYFYYVNSVKDGQESNNGLEANFRY